MVNHSDNETIHPTKKLSPREQECLYWISQGKTAEETSMILGLKYCTVLSYIRILKGKFNCITLPQVVFKVAQLGLIHEIPSKPYINSRVMTDQMHKS